MPRPPRDRRRGAASGELASLPWSGGSDELDLERTLEALAGNPYPEETDIVVRERVRQRRSVVLVVDVSGSMKGERVRTAAATVGALAGELARDALAVVAFWSDAAVLVRLGEQVAPLAVLDLLLRVPAQGLTNVTFALETAARQLAGVPPRDARVLLLSRLRAQRRARPAARPRPGCPAWTSCWTPPASTTSSSAATSPGPAAAGSGWSATTATSPPRSRPSSPTDPGAASRASAAWTGPPARPRLAGGQRVYADAGASGAGGAQVPLEGRRDDQVVGPSSVDRGVAEADQRRAEAVAQQVEHVLHAGLRRWRPGPTGRRGRS